jgi:phage FluMu gp28-like protein
MAKSKAEKTQSGITWMPRQAWLIQNRHKHVLARKHRRGGFTFALAYKDVRDTVEQCIKDLPKEDCWFTSQDLPTAKEYIRDAANFTKVFAAVQTTVDEAWLDFEERDPDTQKLSKAQIKTYYIEFPNGARITAMSSNPNALHGRGGRVRIDEMAWHKDAGKMYDEAGPCIKWGGNMVIISNPSIEGTAFDSLCDDAKAELHLPPEKRFWSYNEITIYDSVREGLVEKVRRLSRPATEAEKQEFIDECRRECRTEEAWLRNYMCVSASASAAFIPFDTIVACESDRATEVWADDAARPMGPVYMGIDIGRTHDLTVAWIAELLGDVLWTRAIHVYKGVTFARQREEFKGLAKRYQVARVAIDAGGIGMNVAEDLARDLGELRVDQVHLGVTVQADLASRLLQRFQDRTIRIPVSGALKDDLLGVRRVDLAGGGVRLETVRTAAGHADRFWAAALLCRAAQSGQEFGPIREGSYAGMPCQAALVGAAAGEGGITW